MRKGEKMLKFNHEVGYPTNTEKGQFVEYLMCFYGKDPKWDAVYPEISMGIIDAVECMEEFLNGKYESAVVKGEHIWGGGDTIDREIVRDIFLKKCEKTLDKPC